MFPVEAGGWVIHETQVGFVRTSSQFLSIAVWMFKSRYRNIIKGFGSTYLTSGQLNLEQGSVLILVLLR